MYKLYFELTKLDEDNQVTFTDFYFVNLDESGLFFRLIVRPLFAIFKKFLKNIYEKESADYDL